MTGIISGATNLPIAGVFVGAAPAAAVYMGATLVWTRPGPQRIAVAQWASGPSNGYTTTRSMTTPTFDVRAGDLIVVMSSTLNSYNYGPAPTGADLAGNTYTLVPAYNSGDHAEFVYAYAIAASDHTGNAFTLSFGNNIYGCVTAIVYRAPAGKTWAIDTPNIALPDEVVYSPTPSSFSVATSGSGVVVVCYVNGSTGSSVGDSGSCTGAEIQAECPPNPTADPVYVPAGIGYLQFVADILTASALSSRALVCDFLAGGSSATCNRDAMIVPFTYS